MGGNLDSESLIYLGTATYLVTNDLQKSSGAGSAAGTKRRDWSPTRISHAGKPVKVSPGSRGRKKPCGLPQAEAVAVAPATEKVTTSLRRSALVQVFQSKSFCPPSVP